MIGLKSLGYIRVDWSKITMDIYITLVDYFLSIGTGSGSKVIIIWISIQAVPKIVDRKNRKNLKICDFKQLIICD